jgi:hypothetical protein
MAIYDQKCKLSKRTNRQISLALNPRRNLARTCTRFFAARPSGIPGSRRIWRSLICHPSLRCRTLSRWAGNREDHCLRENKAVQWLYKGRTMVIFPIFMNSANGTLTPLCLNPRPHHDQDGQQRSRQGRRRSCRHRMGQGRRGLTHCKQL